MGHFFYLVRCTPENIESRYQSKKFLHKNPLKAKKKALQYLQEIFKNAIENRDILLTDNIDRDCEMLYGNGPKRRIEMEKRNWSFIKYDAFINEENHLDFAKILGCRISYPHKYLSKISLELYDGRSFKTIFSFQNGKQYNNIHLQKIEAQIFTEYLDKPFIQWTKEHRILLKSVPIVQQEELYLNKSFIKKYETIFQNDQFKDKVVLSTFSFAEFEKNALAFHNTKNGFIYLKFEYELGFILFDSLRIYMKNLHPKMNIIGSDVCKYQDFYVVQIIKGRKILKSFNGKYYFRHADLVGELNEETTMNELLQDRTSDYADTKDLLEIL